MDIRGPSRPQRPAPSSRRAMFQSHHPGSRRGAHPSTISSQQLSTLHIPAEESNPEDDLIERDSSGNYIIASPGGAPVPGEIREIENEIEQENQMIELCAQHVYARDQHATQRIPFEHWPHGDPHSTLKAVLDASLERKVLSLDRDRWMFEGDGKSKN
ncbi:hypothetical protein K491DRAFT_716839 [Lophiostoma macrostomum CBS 122681]|uniref:Uncharacterized protein n=1 Tax=Lophiostoma macrostomum CBS 122681 TaxID=1314788 RepID=A0A6A6T825_9PLEO|nr:hypothetical protein K491DRAFT_716839 [Lophiostoma macrostomum CBS 122681]